MGHAVTLSVSVSVVWSFSDWLVMTLCRVAAQIRFKFYFVFRCFCKSSNPPRTITLPCDRARARAYRRNHQVCASSRVEY